MDKKLQRRQAIPILLVLLLGYIGFSLALPIFPPMLFDPKHGMLPSYHSEAVRSMIMGALIAMYPIGQFIGCPLLGKLSDIYGRRKVLLISLLAIVPCYLLSGIAVATVHISLLFFSRILCGLFEGNIVIATAAMADISENHADKVKNFGWILAVSSSGFIIGPLIGGKLADSTLVPWFDYATPFWLSAIIVALAWVVVYFRFVETRKAHPNIKFEPLKTLKSLYKSWNIPKLRPVYFANFKIYLAFFFFFAFLPVILVRQFNFTASLLAEVESYLSIPICLSPLLYKKISKHLVPKQATALAGGVFFVSVLLILIFNTPKSLVFTLLPPGICIAIGFTYSTLMISDRVDEKHQGEALGTNQAILVSSETLAGLVGGLLGIISIKLPVLVGAFLALSSCLWLMFKVKKEVIKD